MTGKEVWLAVVAAIAAIAAGLGIKIGRRGADKRVAKVANEMGDKMKEDLGGRIDEDLAEIDDRPVTDDVVADLESRLRRGTKPRR
jgi:hypothetical protein